jgi:hypothetical protein
MASPEEAKEDPSPVLVTFNAADLEIVQAELNDESEGVVLGAPAAASAIPRKATWQLPDGLEDHIEDGKGGIIVYKLLLWLLFSSPFEWRD